MSDRQRALLPRLIPFFAVLLFGTALLVLRRELSPHRYADIIEHLKGLGPLRLASAMGITLLCYAVLTRYDALAMRYIRRQVPSAQVMLASFIAYSLSQTLGFALFTGGALRYRFWSSWGLAGPEIARAVAFAGLTLWMGTVTLAGIALVTDPEALGAIAGLHPTAFRLLGVLLLLLVAGYLAASFRRNRSIAAFGWQFDTPAPLLAFEQVIVSCLDWGLAAAVLYVLLPETRGLGFFAFAGIFVLAQIAGLASHVPGGLGVFDTLIVVLLRPFANAGAVLGALVAFRAIYYLVPFVLGTLLLLLTEALRQRARVGRAARWAGRWLPGITPYALAVLTLGAGIVLLISGATPGVPSRLRWLGEILPLPVIEASHFLGSMAGMGLVILAWGLSRRLDAAYYFALILLGIGIAASLLKGADYEEAILLASTLALLLPARRRFYRRTKLLAEPFTREWVTLVLLVLIGTLALGEFRYRHVAYANELWWRFALQADAPRFLRASIGALVVATGFGLFRLMRPSRPEPSLPAPPELDRAEAIIRELGNPQSNLALMGDKALLFSESGRGFLAYGVAGRCWVAMGDPVAPKEELAELAWAFRALAHQHAAWTAFYEVGREHLPLYLDLGLTLSKLGEEARVALPGFSLEGSNRRGLRRSFRQVEREAASFEVVPREAVPELVPELKQVSDEWLAGKRTREKGFSMGGFDPAYLRRFRHAIVRRENQVVAFANLWETGKKDSVSMDLMRYGVGAPDNVMDYLFTNMLLWAKAEGYLWFNLGMAPLSGFERRSLAPLWHRVGSLIFEHAERVYGFQGLRHYKDKFDPVWEPRYLASSGGLALPRILAGIAALVSDGWRGVVTK